MKHAAANDQGTPQLVTNREPGGVPYAGVPCWLRTGHLRLVPSCLLDRSFHFACRGDRFPMKAHPNSLPSHVNTFLFFMAACFFFFLTVSRNSDSENFWAVTNKLRTCELVFFSPLSLYLDKNFFHPVCASVNCNKHGP